MDTLSSSVSTFKVPNLNSTPREVCHLKTSNTQRQLPPQSPRRSHFLSSVKTATATNALSTSFTTHRRLTLSPFFSVSHEASTTLISSSPYAHQKPACGYAAALLDIAQCNSSLDAVQKDVQKLSKLLQNDHVQAFLRDPFVGDKEKGKAVKELAVKGKFNEHLVRLLKLLIERNKLEIVTEVLGEFERIHDELSQTKQVWISSDKEIEKDRLIRIAKRVQKLSGAVKVKVRNLVKDKMPSSVV